MTALSDPHNIKLEDPKKVGNAEDDPRWQAIVNGTDPGGEENSRTERREPDEGSGNS